MNLSIPITRAQAQLLAQQIQASQRAAEIAATTLTVLTLGHAPDGSAFVQVDTDSGILTVSPPVGG